MGRPGGGRKVRSITFILLVILTSSLYGSVSAQTQVDPNPYETKITIEGFHLKGGMANRVEGDVNCVKFEKGAQVLKTNQTLGTGDVINVGPNGRAEILLNPGYYLRLSANTRATLLDLSRENLKVRISSGSAILEVLEVAESPSNFWPRFPMNSSMRIARFAPGPSGDSLPEIYQPVTFFTPQGDLVAMTGGIYRIDVRENGPTELKVTKGLAVSAGKRVEDGMSASLQNGKPTLTATKKGFEDAFDTWSRDRAALMVKHNKSLKNMGWYKVLRNDGWSSVKITDDERNDRTRNARLVSAIGGLVNVAEDGALFKSEESEWKTLTKGIGLNYEDTVKTGEDSRVEIIVYPICYLHLAANTEMVYSEAPDGGAAVKLLRGSAIITYEPDGINDPLVSFIAPEGRYEIVKNGVYRLNIGPRGDSEIVVYDGAVRVAGREIKTGKKAVFQNTELAISPIDKKSEDTFDVWSRKRPVPSRRRNRAQYLQPQSHINTYQSGMWYFNPYVGTHTFVAGRWRMKSPYGGQYSINFAGRH